MEKLVVNGGLKLCGTVKTVCAKNAVLPVLAASVMADGEIILLDCPEISDVKVMLDILRRMGCDVKKYDDGSVHINSQSAYLSEVPQNISKELRSSIFMMGSILSKFKKAIVSYPGGCEIGLRPIDFHVKGLRALNVKIKEEDGYIFCDGSEMCGGFVHLDYPSVGATENIMMAATLCKGVTIINNAAKEPEIVDLANFINTLGGKIKGAGSDKIEIIGVKSLNGGSYRCIGDRIYAGTMLLAGVMTGGEIELTDINYNYLQPLVSKLCESACKIECFSDKIYVYNSNRMKAIRLTATMPYPGFPTDLQAPLMSALTIADGTSIIVENLFETRFKHVPELIKMGAEITVKDRVAIIDGVKKLHSADVTAKDLRGGAALVLAALTADGNTVINEVNHIDRGYVAIEKTLANLGADIKRIAF